MKKNYISRNLIVALCCLFTAMSVKAERLFTEDFDYQVGQLSSATATAASTDAWWAFSGTKNYIQVVENSLTYTGYQDEAKGGAAELAIVSSGADDLRTFKSVTTGSVYVAALVNVKVIKMSTSGDYFLALGDGGTSNMYPRICAMANDDLTKVKFGITKLTETKVYHETEYNLNETILLVAKYTFVDGEKNDVAELFINPTISATEPTATFVCDATAAAGKNDATSISSVNLRQGSSTPNVIVDAIRVATSWSDLFSANETPGTPVITASDLMLDFDFIAVGETAQQVVNIKAQDLTADITVNCEAPNVTFSSTTIPAAEAMSTNGYDLTITVEATDEGEFYPNITLSSAGAENVTIETYWMSSYVTEITDLATLRAKKDNGETIFRLKGEIGISYTSSLETYFQDATGGIAVDAYSMSYDVARGEHYANIVAYTFFNDRMYLYPAIMHEPTRTAEVQPVVATIEELQANPSRYESCLVRINGVDFGTKAGGTFATANNTVTQNGKTIQVGVFSGSDLIGGTIPAKADVVGIVRNAAASIITMRDANDLISEGSGINEVEIANRVWVAGNTLFVEAGVPVNVVVFNLLGKQVAAQSAVESAEFALPAGAYLVKVGNKATKVIVK